MAVSADGVKQFISFVAWAGFTFSSHYSGKLWFNSRQGDSLQKTLILTVTQLATGIAIGLVTCLLRGKLKEVKLDPITFLLGVCHGYGSLLTNGSMSVTNATVTHMIKMSEPLCTMIGMMTMGYAKMDNKLVLIMLLVITCAFGAQPSSAGVASSTSGIVMALGSNILYATRNIGSKASKTAKSTTLIGFTRMSLSGLIGLIPVYLIGNYSLLVGSKSQEPYLGVDFILMAVSSVSHCAYSLISLTVILAVFQPIQHALLNTCKRMVIVLLFYVLTANNWTYINVTCALISITLSIIGSHYNQMDAQSFHKVRWSKRYIYVGLIGIGLLVFTNIGVSKETNQLEVLEERNNMYPSGVPEKNIHIQVTQNNSAVVMKQNKMLADWLTCIHDIQENIMDSVRKNLAPENVKSGIPLLMVDPAYHANLGDVLISYGEKVLIERLGFMNHTECGIASSVGKNHKCKAGENGTWFQSFQNGPGVAFWHGGGNWGDLYFNPPNPVRMQTITELALKGYNVIGMPQSLHYMSPGTASRHAEKWSANINDSTLTDYSAKKLITLTWRQQNSFDQAQELYPFVNNILVPDVAFMVGPLPDTDKWSTNKDQYNVLFLLRTDGESIVQKEAKTQCNCTKETYVTQLMQSNGDSKDFTFRVVDWLSPNFEFLNKTIHSNSTDADLEYKVNAVFQ